MRIAALATLMVLLGSAGAALAQPSMTPPSAPAAAPYYPYQPPATQTLAQPPQVEAPKATKSEGTARALALGSTALGVVMMGSAFESESGEMLVGGLALSLVGPSMGHIYAGETGHAVKMSLLRTGGFIAFVAGAVSYDSIESDYANCSYDYNCSYPSHDSDKDKAKAAMWVGGLVVVAGTIYDLVDSARAAKRFNDKQRAGVAFGPTMIQGTRGPAPVPAVGLSGSF